MAAHVLQRAVKERVVFLASRSCMGSSDWRCKHISCLRAGYSVVEMEFAVSHDSFLFSSDADI